MSKRKVITGLIILITLFCFRVLAQLLQIDGNIEYLPDFEAWHSATIPYKWLLVSQILIVFFSIAVIFRIQTDRYKYHASRAKWLLWIGSIYFALMLGRFLLSVSILQSHPWFGATLPAFFHMVLAGFLILLGSYENKRQT